MRIRFVRLIVSSSTKFDNRIRSTSSTNILVRQSSIKICSASSTNILVRQGSIIGFVRQVGFFVEFNRIISLPEKFDQVRLKLIELDRTVSLSEKFD